MSERGPILPLGQGYFTYIRDVKNLQQNIKLQNETVTIVLVETPGLKISTQQQNPLGLKALTIRLLEWPLT